MDGKEITRIGDRMKRITCDTGICAMTNIPGSCAATDRRIHASILNIKITTTTMTMIVTKTVRRINLA